MEIVRAWSVALRRGIALPQSCMRCKLNFASGCINLPVAYFGDLGLLASAPTGPPVYLTPEDMEFTNSLVPVSHDVMTRCENRDIEKWGDSHFVPFPSCVFNATFRSTHC